MQSIEGQLKLFVRLFLFNVSWIGEIVQFPKTVRPRGVVEQWLGSVEQAMFDSVKHYLKVKFFYFSVGSTNLVNIWISFQLGLVDIKTQDYVDWIQNHHGQVVLTISQVIYTREVNQALDSSSDDVDDSLTKIRDEIITTINRVCSLVFIDLEETKLLTVEALLTLQVHWRDIFDVLIQNHVRSTFHEMRLFHWFLFPSIDSW